METLKVLNNSNPNKFVIRDTEHLISVLKKLNLSRDMAIFNIQKYGYQIHQDYILECLGFSSKKNKKVKISETVLEQAKLFSILFNTPYECYVRLRNKETGEIRAYNTESLKDAYRLQAILKSRYFSNNNDMMYSLNCYNNMYTADENSLFSLQNFALDVDFDVEQYKTNEVKEIIKNLYTNNEIPVPNIIEFGHRIRLIYTIEDVAIKKGSKKPINLIKKVAKVINDKLPKELNSSVQALTTFGRIIGSINTKNNLPVQVEILNPNKYVLRDLQNSLLEQPEWLKKVKKANSKVVAMQNPYTLNLARLKDLERIQKIRQDGYKELLCYLYRNYCLLSNMSEEQAWNETKVFNNNFERPRKENILDSDTKHLNRKQYLHKNETILELLDITPEDEISLNLKTIISNEEKKRRDRIYQKNKYHENKKDISDYKKQKYQDKLKTEGKMSKNEQNEILKQKIKDLLAEGLKQKDIASILNISERTLKRRISEIKKDN